MKTSEFLCLMDVNLRELVAIAEDLEELGSKCETYAKEQSILTKAARIYDAVSAIKHGLQETKLKARDDG